MSIFTASQAAYLVAALLFILALAGLSRHETAKVGNTLGMAGMVLALAATIALAVDSRVEGLGLGLLAAAMVIGAGIGLQRARAVEMTGMPELIAHVTVFALAVVVGFYVIGHVHHALHTPLMSVTNAISGIIVVGALLQIGHDSAVVTALAFVAILLASINVFGGFAVTRRMLGMFTRGPAPTVTAVGRNGR